MAENFIVSTPLIMQKNLKAHDVSSCSKEDSLALSSFQFLTCCIHFHYTMLQTMQNWKIIWAYQDKDVYLKALAKSR